MGVTLCQDSSRMLSTILLLTIIKAVYVTNLGEQSDSTAATRVQHTPEQSQQQKNTASPIAPPRLLETTINIRKLQGLKRQYGATNHYLNIHILRHLGVPTTPNIHLISGHQEHTYFAQDEYATFVSVASSKELVKSYFRYKRNAVTEIPLVTTTNSTPLTHNPSSEISTFGNMFLCDHPPETFSFTFLGYSWDACLRYDRMFVQHITDTLDICNLIYTLTESNPQKFYVGSFNTDEGPLTVITDEKYVQSCLPLFRRFNNCEEREFLTICWEEKLVFFHSYNCPHSSNDIFLAGFLLGNDTHCFHEFCEGWQSVVDSEVDGLVYRLMNTRHNKNSPSCGYMTMSLSHIYSQYNGTLYLLVNNHWPCCYPLYLVIWAGLPEEHGLNGAWSYLSPACQAGEVLLLVLVGCVMVGGVGGNLMVLVVMGSGGHRSQESSLLRTSLAFADLLSATFVVFPSFVQHFTPFLSSPQYYLVKPEFTLTASSVNVTSAIYITNALHGWSGFSLFQSILFSTTSIVSQLMLLVLSLERFVITGRYLRYRDYFNYSRTVLAITIAWITSLAIALWFAASEGGGLGAQWLTFEKLPTGSSGVGPGGVRNIIYHGQFVIFFMLGISVTGFSALAIHNFVREQLHVAAEWRSLKMKVSRRFSQDNRHILTTMTLMLILFLTSTLPLVINITMNSVSYKFQQQTLFSYLSWWLFMAATAWNPWVYNFRSHQFREDIQKFRRQVGQACQQQQPLDDPLSSPTPPSESLQLTSRSR